jgi:hypothetical protein
MLFNGHKAIYALQVQIGPYHQAPYQRILTKLPRQPCAIPTDLSVGIQSCAIPTDLSVGIQPMVF